MPSFPFRVGFSATFLNTRSNSGLGSSAPTSRAISMKRLDCAGSSGFGLRGMRQAYARRAQSAKIAKEC